MNKLSDVIAQAMADYHNDHRYDGDSTTAQSVEPLEYDAEDFEEIVEHMVESEPRGLFV